MLNLTLGFSHPVAFAVPEGITIETPSQTEVLVKGIDRQKVGQVAAEIRGYRPPEPYKGKGVRYAGEKISLKEGKKKSWHKIADHQERPPASRAPRPRAKIRELGKAVRLTVHRTPRHIYAQIISADGEHDHRRERQTVQEAVSKNLQGTGNARLLPAVGRAIAERAKAAGITRVAFDRSGFMYHGRIKALAEAAREAGLEF